MYTVLQAEEQKHPGALAQTVAHELAHCFQEENFPDQNEVKYRFIKWREEGFATYLSHVVYPTTNHEWTFLPFNDDLYLTTTVMDVSYGNFLFFQYLEGEIGIENIFRLVKSLPDSGGRKNQEEALASFRNIRSLFHGYAEAMIDGTIVDNGATLIPYKREYGTVAITGTVSVAPEFKPFGLKLLRLTIADCKIAQFEFDWKDARATTRPESRPTWARFPQQLPEGSDGAHDMIYLLTTTEKAKLPLAVTQFKDDPACEGETTGSLPSVPEACAFCEPSKYYRSKG